MGKGTEGQLNVMIDKTQQSVEDPDSVKASTDSTQESLL